MRSAINKKIYRKSWLKKLRPIFSLTNLNPIACVFNIHYFLSFGFSDLFLICVFVNFNLAAICLNKGVKILRHRTYWMSRGSRKTYQEIPGNKVD